MESPRWIPLLLAIFLGRLPGTEPYVDPVYSPMDLTDSGGNHADQNNQVTWADFPTGSNYTKDPDFGNKVNLDTYFDMVEAFLWVLQPSDPPYDLVSEAINGDMEDDGIKELGLYGIGIVFCFVVGILFIIVMPIVGCCFCSCRLCGNCGGKMMQKQRPNDQCKCIGFSATLICILILTGAGACCLMAVNENMSSSYTHLDDAVITNLDNLLTFLENTALEMEFVALDGFSFTSSMVSRDLNNINVLVGLATRNRVDAEAGVTTTVNGILGMDAAIDKVLADFTAIDAATTELQTEDDDLETELQAVSSDITATQSQSGCAASCQAIDISGLQLGVNYDNLPDITMEILILQTAQAGDLAAAAEEGKESFDAIPDLVADNTQDIATSVKEMMSDYTVEVDGYLGDIQKLPNEVVKPIDDLKDSLTDFSDKIDEFDQYRWYAMGGLVMVIGAVVVLSMVAVCMGAASYDSKTLPTERGCPSNAAGIMLMVSVGFSWLFCCVLAYFVVLPFLPGCFMQKLLCEPLMDPEYKAFKTLIDEPGGMFGDKYFFGDLLLSDGSIPLTVSGALQDCQRGKAAYTALMLDKLFDLKSMLDYKDSVDIASELAKADVDFSSVSIINAETEALLRELGRAVQIDYDYFQTLLSQDTVQTDLSDLANTLRSVANDGTNTNPAKAELLAEADDLDDIERLYATPLATKQSNLLDDIDKTEAYTADIPDETDQLIDDAHAAETYVRANAMDVTKDYTADLSDRLIAIVDKFMNHTDDMVRTEVAKCSPIWHFWQSMVHETMCKDFIWLLNGFWFALGWCLFMMVPGIIFSVKLAKYFRTMKYAETLDKMDPQKGTAAGAPAPGYKPGPAPGPAPGPRPVPARGLAPAPAPVLGPALVPVSAPAPWQADQPPPYNGLPPAPNNIYDNGNKMNSAPPPPAKAPPQLTPVGFEGLEGETSNNSASPLTTRPTSPTENRPKSPPSAPKPPKFSKSNKVGHHDMPESRNESNV